jgi:hypothetical protein
MSVGEGDPNPDGFDRSTVWLSPTSNALAPIVESDQFLICTPMEFSGGRLSAWRLVRCLTEMGMGVDVHGLDYNERR